jgi:hypothetical protein
VVALDDSTAAEVRRRCDAHIRTEGIKEIVNRTHYAVVRRAGG